MLMHDHAPFAFHKQVLTYAFTADTTARNGWRFSYVQVTRSTVAPIRAPLSFRKIPAVILGTGGERDGDSVR